MGKFECTRCGNCCRETLAETPEGHLFGLYLEPNEIGRFPKEMVFPLLGRGDPVTIVAYQLGVNRCPNYAEESGLGRCRIYADRPLVCAAFPITSRRSVSPRCPGVQKQKDGIDPDSVQGELAAHTKKLDGMVSREPAMFIWPLDKKRWIPLVDAVYSGEELKRGNP